MNNLIKPRLIHVSETTSTNHYLRMIADRERLASGSIVVADFQTAGRGISGSSWESEAGKNLTFSVLYYPDAAPLSVVPSPLLGKSTDSLDVAFPLQPTSSPDVPSCSHRVASPLPGVASSLQPTSSPDVPSCSHRVASPLSGVASSLYPFVISEAVSLSVKFTLDKFIPDITVKWPNDIYCGDKKMAGILIENTLFQGEITQSIIGIGINVNQTLFLSDTPNPVSMAQVAGVAFDRMALLHDFRQTFAEQSARLDNRHFDAIHADYLHAMYRRTGLHPYHDDEGVFEAVLLDIEPTGHLLLERRDGRISRYAFKEVSYLY